MRYAAFAIPVLLAVAVVGLVWYGNRPTRVAEATFPVQATVLTSGDSSSVTTRENYLITSPDEFRRLWGLLETSAPLPSVDFAKDNVIAVFAGQEPSAGYAIRVASVADSATTRMVTVLIATPGPSCGAAPTPTTPYQVLELPKTALTLTHEDEATTTSCWGT